MVYARCCCLIFFVGTFYNGLHVFRDIMLCACFNL